MDQILKIKKIKVTQMILKVYMCLCPGNKMLLQIYFKCLVKILHIKNSHPKSLIPTL